MKLKFLLPYLVMACFSYSAFAKLPPPKPAPPLDPVAVAAKAEKDKAAAEKAKVLQADAEDRAVKNFQANMKKAGKPVPKPTPIVVAAAPGAAPVPSLTGAKAVASAKDVKAPATPPKT